MNRVPGTSSLHRAVELPCWSRCKDPEPIAVGPRRAGVRRRFRRIFAWFQRPTDLDEIYMLYGEQASPVPRNTVEIRQAHTIPLPTARKYHSLSLKQTKRTFIDDDVVTIGHSWWSRKILVPIDNRQVEISPRKTYTHDELYIDDENAHT